MRNNFFFWLEISRGKREKDFLWEIFRKKLREGFFWGGGVETGGKLGNFQREDGEKISFWGISREKMVKRFFFWRIFQKKMRNNFFFFVGNF